MKRRDVLQAAAAASVLAIAQRSAPALAQEVVRITHRSDAAPLPNASAAYRWIDIMQEIASRDVLRNGARPTILSRAMGITVIAMYDAWAAYDATATANLFGAALRRPLGEQTIANKAEAIAYAVTGVLADIYPLDSLDIAAARARMGYSAPALPGHDTPAGIGTLVAQAVIADRQRDGANQRGDEVCSSGKPYGDYTYYRPVNPVDRILNPDLWQPIIFSDGKGGHVTPAFLTPHWYRVKPFALSVADQFRAPPPPLVGSDQLRSEVDEVLRFSAALDPRWKAIVEFMRDGPRSTGQSGHWLRMAQDVSRRDANGLDADVKLFFATGMAAMDAFIAAWETKRFYDTARPWTLIHHYYADADVDSWGGPGKGTIRQRGAAWRPYSPDTFLTPPFPGYVSGHSTVSAACAEALRIMTGSDVFGAELVRHPGELTEQDFIGPDVRLFLPTFTAAAEMAGISRVYGGYHTQSDNIEGLKMGRRVGSLVADRVKGLLG